MTDDNEEGAKLLGKGRIGNLNGTWSLMFRAVLAGNALMLPAVVGWGSWVTAQLYELNTHVEVDVIDRFTASMFIEVQDQLAEKNKEVHWLDAREVREIQRNNHPYGSGY